MILNGNAVLDGFITLLRLSSGLLVIVLAAFAWRQWRRAALPDHRQTLEDRSYLLFRLPYWDGCCWACSSSASWTSWMLGPSSLTWSFPRRRSFCRTAVARRCRTAPAGLRQPP